MATIHASAERGGILLLTFDGKLANEKDVDQFVADTQAVTVAVKNHHNAEGKRIRVLIDIGTLESGPNFRAFDALVKLARQDKDLVEKTAIFGGTSQLQTIGQTAVYLAGRDNIKFFQNRAEALEWLG